MNTWRIIAIHRQGDCVLTLLVCAVTELYEAVTFLRYVAVCIAVRLAKVYVILADTYA